MSDSKTGAESTKIESPAEKGKSETVEKTELSEQELDKVSGGFSPVDGRS